MSFLNYNYTSNQKSVIDTEEQVLQGLFAAGELVGGLFYQNYPGGSGLTAGAVFGRISGRAAARFALGEAADSSRTEKRSGG